MAELNTEKEERGTLPEMKAEFLKLIYFFIFNLLLLHLCENLCLGKIVTALFYLWCAPFPPIKILIQMDAMSIP